MVTAVEDYIHFYNHTRITIKHDELTPMEIRSKAVA
ncbi:IS3 family transposase [Enterococcus italicus]